MALASRTSVDYFSCFLAIAHLRLYLLSFGIILLGLYLLSIQLRLALRVLSGRVILLTSILVLRIGICFIIGSIMKTIVLHWILLGGNKLTIMNIWIVCLRHLW